jgi:hypothetical protein
VNAGMAAINKALFPNASNVDKLAIDSLETALYQEFLQIESQLTINTSADFGKSVANAFSTGLKLTVIKMPTNAYTAPVGRWFMEAYTPCPG